MPKRESPPPQKPEFSTEDAVLTGLAEVDSVVLDLPNEIMQRISEIYDTYLHINRLRPNEALLNENLVIPPNVSSLMSTELGDLHGRYAAWYSYFVDRIKFLRVASQVLAEEVRRIYAVHLTSYTGKEAVDVKKMKAEIEPDYLGMRRHQLRVDAAIGILDDDLKRYDKLLSVLSREISRREHNAGY